MVSVTAAGLRNAMRRYDAGDRPFRFTQPRALYLVSSAGRVYPLKYVFALALGVKPSSFNTSDAVREVAKHGIDIRREPKNHDAEFSALVMASLADPKARAARLEKAPKAPRKILRESFVFERNYDVVAEVLSRAKGRCEGCKKAAPFSRRHDGSAYLEVHHRVQLAHGGLDTVENAVALCPNCHRCAHYG